MIFLKIVKIVIWIPEGSRGAPGDPTETPPRAPWDHQCLKNKRKKRGRWTPRRRDSTLISARNEHPPRSNALIGHLVCDEKSFKSMTINANQRPSFKKSAYICKYIKDPSLYITNVNVFFAGQFQLNEAQCN